jgi:hypothetical protein
MAWIATAVTVGGAVLSSSRASSNADAQNAQAAEQYAIDSQYHGMLTAYQGELENFSAHQLAFSQEQQAYANRSYQIAVENRNAEIAYRQEQVDNQKLAAKTEYNAQGHVAKIRQDGAEAQAEAVINDTLRVAGADKRELAVQADKMMGVEVAKRRSGLAQGRSKDRIIADAFVQRNKAMGDLNSKAKASIIQTIQAKDKINNDSNIKLAESYRGLEAIMKLKPAPVAQVAPPQPVFDYVAPLQPLAPLGASPAKISGPSFLETGLNAASGLNFGSLNSVMSNSSGSATIPMGNLNSNDPL